MEVHVQQRMNFLGCRGRAVEGQEKAVEDPIMKQQECYQAHVKNIPFWKTEILS